eukprot:320417_1
MSWYKAGNSATVNGAVVAQTTNNHQTTYGVQEVSTGQHEWKIKVHACANHWMNIGISSNTKYLNGSFYNKQDANPYSIYGLDGRLYKYGTSEAYANGAANFRAGDTVTVHLDLDKAEMSYSKNGSNCGIAFRNIVKNQKYRLAVCTYYQPTKFELISYINLSEESKEKENESIYIKDC